MAVWQEKRLGEIAEINPKVTLLKNKLYSYIDIEQINPANRYVNCLVNKVYTGQSCSKFFDGDIVFSRITPCLENRKIAQVKIDNQLGFGSTEFIVFREKPKLINQKFLYYLIISDNIVLPAINSMSGASGRQRADKNFIQKIKINIPDLATQEKIADILSNYDDLIENNNRRIEILEQMAQEIYKEWFVRFRFPGHEKVKFVNGLPEGWEVVKLGDFVNIKGGKRLPTGKDFCIEQTEHPYIRIRDISKYKFIPLTENMMYIDNATFNILNRFTVKKGDLLISIVGTIGLVACVGSTLNGANLTENCVNITEVRHFTKSYLYHYLKSSQGQGELYSGIVGVSQPKLPIYNIKKFKLLKPSQKLIIDFTNLVADIDSKMNNLLEQNQNLIKQRDLLLPRLMSGKLEV